LIVVQQPFKKVVGVNVAMRKMVVIDCCENVLDVVDVVVVFRHVGHEIRKCFIAFVD
jgi:hypothetical protein